MSAPLKQPEDVLPMTVAVAKDRYCFYCKHFKWPKIGKGRAETGWCELNIPNEEDDEWWAVVAEEVHRQLRDWHNNSPRTFWHDYAEDCTEYAPQRTEAHPRHVYRGRQLVDYRVPHRCVECHRLIWQGALCLLCKSLTCQSCHTAVEGGYLCLRCPSDTSDIEPIH